MMLDVRRPVRFRMVQQSAHAQRVWNQEMIQRPVNQYQHQVHVMMLDVSRPVRFRMVQQSAHAQRVWNQEMIQRLVNQLLVSELVVRRNISFLFFCVVVKCTTNHMVCCFIVVKAVTTNK